MTTLKELEKDLLAELGDDKEEILESEYPDDIMREYIEGVIPVYNSDLLGLAQSDLWLAVEEPEIMAFDGKNTAINSITGNIYEHLLEIANNWLKEQKDERQKV